MKLFVFESHPVQYHAPVYRELSRIVAERSLGSVKVVYASDISLRGHKDPGFGARVAWDEPLLEGYDSLILNNEHGTPLTGFSSLTGRGIWSLLRREKPDAVLLTGLAYRFDWTALIAARLLGIRVWLRTETQDYAFARSEGKSLLRELAYRTVYRAVDHAFPIGALNAEHYRRHGISSDRLTSSPYCVVDRFATIPEDERARMRRELRAELGIGDAQTVLLFCGKLQHKKNPSILLEALASLEEAERAKFAVLYVGSGELEESVRRQAAELRGAAVHFAGFKNQKELPPYYLASDVLVLPSRQMGETWGLVANEALLAQRRVILSRHVGCGADFAGLPSVRIFDGSVENLAAVLRALPDAESVAGQRQFMGQYSIRAAAQGIAKTMDNH